LAKLPCKPDKLGFTWKFLLARQMVDGKTSMKPEIFGFTWDFSLTIHFHKKKL